MVHALILAVGSAVLVSLVSLAGVATLILGQHQLRRATFLLLSLATGALFGDAVFHLLPEIFQNTSPRLRSSTWILIGILSSFIFEKFLRWKQGHGVHNHDEDIHPIGRIILVSDGLHNFVDGLLIGASFLTNRQVGIATTLAVVLHELPHEIGDFGVLIHAGYSWSRALLFNFLSACLAIVGVLSAFAFQSAKGNFAAYALPVTAGSFLYIAGSNLTPELQKENAPLKSLLQVMTMVMGMGLMALVLLFE